MRLVLSILMNGQVTVKYNKYGSTQNKWFDNTEFSAREI
jgi:hypothetical protein